MKRVAFFLVFFLLLCGPLFAAASDVPSTDGAPAVKEEQKWPGIDESVVERIAIEHGREARSPLINTDQGDLLLFVFLLSGAVGGFVAGYYWRKLMEQRPEARGGER